MNIRLIPFLTPWLFILAATSCSEDHLHSNDGALVARVLHAHEREHKIEVIMHSTREPQNARTPVEHPETILSLTQVPAGLWEVSVNTLSYHGETLRSVRIDDIYIQPDRETEVLVDLSELSTAPVPSEEDPEPEPE